MAAPDGAGVLDSDAWLVPGATRGVRG